ncbi:MAG: 4,5-dihydroxyphthalate decarboxylase [Rhodospirillales bacterium]|nr:4,5-dihydroxyphthalate decarboxylase [Rhodospirillales bacterium]
MTDHSLKLTLACWDHDRAQAVLDGRVTIKGVDLEADALPTTTLFPLAVDAATYDITEMSLSSYIMQVASGTSVYRAIPVFLSRAFRHSGFYVRSGAGIHTPKDLEGRTVGVPEYQMTAALWMRGLLASEYGVDLSTISYRTGGLDGGVRVERLALDLPPGFVVQPMKEGENLNDLLLSGEVDALFTPKVPRAFLQKDPRIQRLFPDYAAVERAYYKKTGFFPVMHTVGIRSTLLDAHPWLAGAVFDAFVESRDIALHRLQEIWLGSANRLSLPWLHETMETTRDLMGDDYWPYGLDKNRAEIEWMCQQSVDQHLATRRLQPEDLFVREGS